MSQQRSLVDILDDDRIIVTAGSGGVGKTTLAAAIGFGAALRGRKVVVLTVDPARRLGDVFGYPARLALNTPTRIDGVWPGKLSIMTFDVRSTFDRLVRTHASKTTTERVMANSFYQNIADSLSGVHEYIAAEVLYELYDDPRFDLVVVDTPPSRVAIDFLYAPDTLARFLNHRLYQALAGSPRGAGIAIGAAANALVATLERLVGGNVVSDAVGFFRAFSELEEGFRQRGAKTSAALRQQSTSFVALSAPRPEALREAVWFQEQLHTLGLSLDALIVNKMQPSVGHSEISVVESLAKAHLGTELGDLAVELVTQEQIAEREAELLQIELQAFGDIPVVRIPRLSREITNLSGLGELTQLLLD